MFDTKENTEVELFRAGGRAFLKIGAESVEIKDYKISSSMHSGTELEVLIKLNSEFMEFLAQERQPKISSPINAIKQAVQQAIGGIAGASQDSSSQSSDT